jgi:two-component system sensor histidine kinase EvgS
VFAQKIAEKSISFSLEMPENNVKNFLLDETRLRQVLLNIIGNAVKFTDRGFIQVSVTLTPTTSAQYIDLIIKVSDSGMGIAQDQLTEIFSAFTQQKQQSLRYGGTGLGLTICKRLMEMMGGEISVDSSLGKGSCFKVELPNLQVCYPSGVIENEKQDSAIETVNFQPASVLIVDDSAINRLVLRAYLEDYPELCLFEAESGKQALELMSQYSFDLILMDRRMPGEDGDSVCEKIRALPDYTEVPIIMISASVLDLEKQHPAFYNLQLNKPVDKLQLLSAMQSFLRTDKNIAESIPQTLAATEPQINTEQTQELYELLSNHYQSLITQFSSSGAFEIDALIEIAQELIEIAEQFHCRLLHDWAQSLGSQAELFDLSNLTKTLNNFDLLLKQLQDNLAQQSDNRKQNQV